MKPVTPLVSIGMPVFNGERYLEQAIDSLLAQTHGDFELIISDNCSTDRTAEICKTYAAQDSRIIYHRSPENHGLAWNYNRVVRLSTGKYFKWAAHDDFCAPEFLELCVDVLDRLPAVVLCHAQVVVVDEFGDPQNYYGSVCHLDSTRPSSRLWDFMTSARWLSNPVFGVMRRSALEATSFGNYVSSDLVLLAELALRGEFYEIPQNLFFRRDHPEKSDRVNVTLEEVAILYDPANRGKIHMRNWRLFVEYLAAINRVPMNVSERFSCYRHMARWFRWNSRALTNELGQLPIRLIRGPESVPSRQTD